MRALLKTLTPACSLRSSLSEDSAGALARVLWRVNRLRCMSPGEIGHRTLRALAQRAERLGLFGPAEAPSPRAAAPSLPWIHRGAQVERAPYLAAAERIVGGRLDVFALKDVELGSPPRWNRDPRTGIEAPLAFGKLLDYRDPSVVGDIKYLWEPNRHAHLVTLAQAYALSGAPRYYAVLRQHLESWFAACPYGRGANWSSALEPAIRLLNWAVAWQLLGGYASPAFQDASGAQFARRWLQSAHEHAHFVRGHFSLYSSANNHLIGEAAGLFVAAATWPHLSRSRDWLVKSQAILEREALLQNAPDGVNREQAVGYQQFELDLLVLAFLAGRANGHPFSPAFEARFVSMLEFLASIMDAGGHLPMFGDDDDGMVVRLSREPDHCRFRSLLATGALLFRRADFKAKAGALDDKSRWLLGAGADRAYGRLDASSESLPVRRAFVDGGYYVLGCDFESDNEIRLVADAGPIGYQSIAAHGHADALSFTLSVGGVEFLVDPGTYAYHTQGAWRAYFRGTAAHNTVRVDGLDQSESGGNFMWLRKARAGCSIWRVTGEQDLFEGWHEGYTRLADPVKHTRRIALYKQERRVVIEDTLDMAGEHLIELYFHCSERSRVDLGPGGCTISQGDRTLSLALPQAPGAQTQLLHGSTAPIGGWVSRRFDHKQPAPTVVWHARIAGFVVLRSEIGC
jgi:hypothetical protein